MRTPRSPCSVQARGANRTLPYCNILHGQALQPLSFIRYRRCRVKSFIPRADRVVAVSSVAADVVAGEHVGMTAELPGAVPKLDSKSSSNIEQFSWTKQWWPVHAIELLDPRKPTGVTLLGHDYVVWWDSAAESDGTTASKGAWRLVQDRCPHRQAPLSLGRIADDGNLLCSYHGWKFDGQGICTSIPQISDPKALTTALNSKRTCVASYPVQVKHGVLFAWLESGVDAHLEASQKEIWAPEALNDDPPLPSEWLVTEQAVDFTDWLEQAMDPTHANFLHHTCGFPMNQALPMPADPVPVSSVSLENGFEWRHGGYCTKNEGMAAIRKFVPPNTVWVHYNPGFLDFVQFYAAPARPGYTRLIGYFRSRLPPAARKKNLWKYNLFGHGPMLSPLVFQDFAMTRAKEAHGIKHGLSALDYVSMSPSDQGVTAAHRWFRMAGYADLWKQRLPDAAAVSPSDGKTTDRLFSVWDLHTKYCHKCQEGMQRMATIAQAVLVVSVGLALASLLCASTATGWIPTLLSAVGSVLLWFGRKHLLKIAHRGYVSHRSAWEEEGGLSLVKGTPKNLFVEL